jgi:DNA-binding response OmpR family regulator
MKKVGNTDLEFTPFHEITTAVMKTIAAKTASAHARSTQRSGRPTSANKSARSHSPKKLRSEQRILLVDDDPTVRESLKAVLVGEGYAVLPAENGAEALKLAARLPVDLALLDLNMPVMNGWDTFQQLTLDHPLTPVIIVTARPNQLFTAVGAGAGALLEKPMDIPTLLKTIKKLLAESADQRLARLSGQETEFHYQSTRVDFKSEPPARQS